MKRIIFTIFTAFSIFGLSACQTTDESDVTELTPAPQTTGEKNEEGIASIPQSTILSYQAYRLSVPSYPHHNLVFVYDVERKKSSWLGRKKHLGVSFAIQEAIDGCKKHTPPRNCKPLDVNGEIVWKGMSEELKSILLTEPKLYSANTITEYSGEEYQINTIQKNSYKRYLQRRIGQNRSVFFIGEDGMSSGASFSITGNSKKETPKDLLRTGNIRCQINTGGRKCYLFAIDDEPINENASAAVE